MTIPGIIGKKITQIQGFLEDGKRVPVSLMSTHDVFVTQIKDETRDGYHAVQLATNMRNKATRPITGHLKKAGIDKKPRFFRELRAESAVDVGVGSQVIASEIFKPGDLINAIGTSKGKGFAGVVKRHGFRGGPRTHGQSDRERAPGSIGQTTTPGRVYKGKKMAGRMGNEQVTIRNLEILDIVDNIIYVKGLIPGPRGTYLSLMKKGVNKKFVPLVGIKKDNVIFPAVEGLEESIKAEGKMEKIEVETAADLVTSATVEEAVKEIETPNDTIIEVAEKKESK